MRLGVSEVALRTQHKAGVGLVIDAVHQMPGQAPTEGQGRRTSRAGVPVMLDRFVGRERELADLRPVLARNRLVTLAGPPGVGKTRLALELTRTLSRSYSAGLWWANLADLPDASALPAAVADAIRAEDQRGTPLEELVQIGSGARSMLILDSCEHVVDACADLVSRLLDASPRLRVLVTSREGLRLPGEVMFPVMPLPVHSGPLTPETNVRQLDAVRLFLDRAHSTNVAFEPTDREVGVIAELCRRLDGLPLAIELCARQIGVLSPDELLARADAPLDLFAWDARQVPVRHHSLRAALTWSYDALDADCQRVFRRLAMLPGGFDQQIAAAVCADLELAPERLWSALTDLTLKSLTVSAPAGARFRILEPVRRFGTEQLDAAGERPAAEERLVAWFTRLARVPLVAQIESRSHRSRIVSERHNLHHAVLLCRRTADERHDELAVMLAQCDRVRGDLGDAQERMERLLQTVPSSSQVRVLALYELSAALSLQGHRADALVPALEARQIAEALDHDRVLTALALTAVEHAYNGVGDAVASVEACRARVALLEQHGPPRLLAGALNSLALHTLAAGEYEAAEASISVALSTLTGDADAAVVTAALHTAGAIAVARDRADRAATYFAMALTANVVDIENAPYNLEGFLVVAARSGDARRALRLHGAARAARVGFVADRWWASLVEEAALGARRQLPAGAADAAVADGAGLSVEEAIRYAIHNDWTGPTHDRQSVLTPREYQTAELVAQGLTNLQIAARLSVSPRTVASHIEHIRTKLDVPTRAHITAWVLNNHPE